MSIDIMTAIWKHSEHKGSELLALLAIGDNANDDGFAFPSYEHIAAKIRMSKRQAQRIVSRLLDSDELSLVTSGTFGQSNVYAVQVHRLLQKPRVLKSSDGQEVSTSPGGHSEDSQVDISGGQEVSTEPSVSQPSYPEPSDKDVGVGPTLPGLEAPASTAPVPADATSDDLVRRVWDHYVAVFGTDHMRIKELTPARATAIRKAVKATDVPSCCAAIDGLKSYRRAHPDGSKDISLGAIFETRPGGRNMTDQIEFWAKQAKPGDEQVTHTTPGKGHKVSLDLSGVSAVLAGRIRARQREVMTGFQLGSEDARERGREAMEWLRENCGWTVTRGSDGSIEWGYIE